MNLPINLSKINPEIPFKKHTAAIHVQGKLTAVDRKLLNVLYKCAYEKDMCKSDSYYLKGNIIAEFLGWKSKVKSEIKSSLRTLRQSGIEWNIFEQDVTNKDDWKIAGGTGFIAGWQYDDSNDIVRFSLSPEIKLLLGEPNIYANIDIRMQKKLKGKYELIFYEYFMEELCRTNSFDFISRWYSVSDIRRMFDIPDDQYKEFKIFSRDCIKQPLKSLNESGVGLFVEIESVERVNRKIVAIRFHIKATDFDQDSIQQNLSFDDENYLSSSYDAIKELEDLFLEAKTVSAIISEAKAVCKDYNVNDFIKANIEYAKRAEHKGQIKTTFLAYLRASIQNDYANYISKIEEHKIIILKSIEKKKIEDKIHSEKLLEDQKFNLAVEEFNKLSEETKEKVYAKCREQTKIFNQLSDDLKKSTAVLIFDSYRHLFNS